ncbi:MAG: tryptophan--tRNA ligase [Proteobacteria bacterium]|nr:tryptophan--tRNA ligase [Pseudomonadota bacterium]
MRVVSGIKPTGNLHLGNYLGAVKQWVAMQDDIQAQGGETMYFIADLHGLTEWIAPADMAANTIEMTATLIAAGIDPERSILFNQTRVPQHSELSWLLNNVARVGWLNRMTQFKDKAGKHKERASVGLYIYPTLMAADILLYKATRVPVGQDQKQHLELTRDIAQKFNNDFGVDFFPIVEPAILEEGARIMSLRDGRQKMSKSDPSDYSRINLTDDAGAIAKKIRKARTDADPIPDNLEALKDRPEALNLVTIYSALAEIPLKRVCQEFSGKGFADFKAALSELAVEKLAPITAEMSRLKGDPAYIDGILAAGAERANDLAAPILKEVHRIIGLAS